jgi:hypothetical protein
MPTDHQIRTTIDIAAGGTALAAVVGWLPPIAALLSIVWIGIQIFTWVRHQGWRR